MWLFLVIIEHRDMFEHFSPAVLDSSHLSLTFGKWINAPAHYGRASKSVRGPWLDIYNTIARSNITTSVGHISITAHNEQQQLMISKEDELPWEWHLKKHRRVGGAGLFFSIGDATVRCVHAFLVEKTFDHERREVSVVPGERIEIAEDDSPAAAWTIVEIGDFNARVSLEFTPHWRKFFCYGCAQVRLLKTHFPTVCNHNWHLFCAHAGHLLTRKNCGENPIYFFAKNTMKASASFLI